MSHKPREITWKVDEDTGCWIITSHRPNGRYVSVKPNGKNMLAHRYMWEQKNGSIPEGLYACHICDNPLCINPDHLFLGTQADNLHDMAAKGRKASQKGMASGRAKLTDEQVCYIRQHKEISGAELARMFDLTRSYVSAIRLRKAWTHLP